MADHSGTRQLFTSTAVIIGVGTITALVVGLVAGLIMDDIPRGLGIWGTAVLVAFSVYGVFAAYRAGTGSTHR